MVSGLLVVVIIITCSMPIVAGKMVNKWKSSELTTTPGHYPQPYCSLTNVVLNTDGVFYYKSDTDLHSESCQLSDDVWDIRHIPELDNVECAEMYTTGYTFPIYYWYTTSNYFHITYDTLMPLYQEVYYKRRPQKDNQGKLAFLPAVESARLQVSRVFIDV